LLAPREHACAHHQHPEKDTPPCRPLTCVTFGSAVSNVQAAAASAAIAAAAAVKIRINAICPPIGLLAG
jgi:hypothetical protein